MPHMTTTQQRLFGGFVNVLMGLAGLWTLMRDPVGRHWGDRLADTRVVNA